MGLWIIINKLGLYFWQSVLSKCVMDINMPWKELPIQIAWQIDPILPRTFGKFWLLIDNRICNNCNRIGNSRCEDSYISHHESYNLPTPEYFVNVSPVQPDLEHSPRKTIRKSSLAKSYAAKYHTIERIPHGYDDQVPILQPPPAFDTSRSDSLSSDTKFDIIIASLQNLAHELEKDFDQDEEIVQPKECITKTRAQSE